MTWIFWRGDRPYFWITCHCWLICISVGLAFVGWLVYFETGSYLCSPFLFQTSCIAQGNLGFLILLPLPLSAGITCLDWHSWITSFVQILSGTWKIDTLLVPSADEETKAQKGQQLAQVTRKIQNQNLKRTVWEQSFWNFLAVFPVDEVLWTVLKWAIAFQQVRMAQGRDQKIVRTLLSTKCHSRWNAGC